MRIQEQETLEKGRGDLKELNDEQIVYMVHILIDILDKEDQDYYDYLKLVLKISNEERILRILGHQISFIKMCTLLSCLRREKSNFGTGVTERDHLDEICFSDWISFTFKVFLEMSSQMSFKYFLLKLSRPKGKIIDLISFDIATKELGFDTLFYLTEFLEKMEETNLWSDIVYIMDSMQFDLSLYKIPEDKKQKKLFDEIRSISKKANYYEKKRSERKILQVRISIILCFIFILVLSPMCIYLEEDGSNSNERNFLDSVYQSVTHACSIDVSSSPPPDTSTRVILISDSLTGVILIGLIAGFVLDWVKPIYKR